MSPPSRRSVLRTSGIAVAGGFAGCLTAPGDDGRDDRSGGTTGGPTDGRRSTTDGRRADETTTAGGRVDAVLAGRNGSDGAVTLTVELRRDGRVVSEGTRTLEPGVTAAFDADVSRPGAYTVVAELESGERVRTDWEVDRGYDGTLEVVVTGDGRLEFRERLSGADCPTDGLLYAVPGAEETFAAGSLVVGNERDRPATPVVDVSHDGETFFRCGFDLDPSQSVTVDGVTATAGTYDVVVDLPDGGRTAYEWHVPARNNYPRLQVVIPTTYDSLVGCGPGGSVDVTVRNETDSPRAATLTLRRGRDAVAEETVDVAAGGSTDVSLDFRIGDTYTVEVTTDAGTARTEVVTCYCFESFRTTATLDGSAPSVESTVGVCE